MRLEDRFQAFLAVKYSKRTIEDHLTTLSYLSRLYPSIPLQALTVDQLRIALGNPLWADATRLLRWKSFDIFYKFLLHDGYIGENPMTMIPRPRAGRARRPPRYTESDFTALMAACHPWHWLGFRDRLILMLLWTTPMRVSELCKIQVSDIRDNRILLHGKGGKIYKAVLWPACASALDDYLIMRPRESDFLLYSRNGLPLRTDTIRQLLRRLSGGLGKKVYPHAFRHNFGINTVHWGLALDVAQKVMGHSSSASTIIYRQWVTEDDALEAIEEIANREDLLSISNL